MKLAFLCENAKPVGIAAGQHITALRISRLFISLISRHIHGTAVTKSIHQEFHRHLFHLLLHENCCLCIFHRCLSRLCISLLVTVKIRYDNLQHLVIVVEDFRITGNVFHGGIMFFHKSFNLQADQFVETHLQNCRCLALCETKLRRLCF